MSLIEELYAFRKLYNATLFNEWAKRKKYSVHKSWYHYGGEPCYGGTMFIVKAHLPTGQISHHYAEKDWGLFKVPNALTASPWDGHTPQTALRRLELLHRPPT